MDLIIEILAEIIFGPIIEGYFLAMTYFSHGSKRVDNEKIKVIVVFECIALLVMFVVGGIMLLETSGESLTGKILLITSITVSLSQFLFGIILRIVKKNKK